MTDVHVGDTEASSTTATATVLSLVRHGETVWHADNRYAGRGSDIDLTERGRRQADLLGRWAANKHFDAVVASPVRRAMETAEPAAVRLGLRVEAVQNLAEVDFGVAEGRTLAELASVDEEMVQQFRDDPSAHPFPGSEAPADAARRGRLALVDVALGHPGKCVLVVGHNTLLRLALCELLGLPVARYRSLFPRLDNAAVTEIRLDPAHGPPPALLSLNSRPWAA